MLGFYQELNQLLANSVPFVSVTLVDSIGSTPQDQGAKMLVTKKGLHYGTVGGGKVEAKALEKALGMLENPQGNYLFVQWNLNKDVGMTCGGTVKFFFESFNQVNWNIVIFGAGHVANSLVNLLINLNCHIFCVDPRREWLEKLPISEKITLIEEKNMPEFVKNIPDNSFVILMSMGHSTDKPILLEIFRQKRKFPYLGVIGSRAKANILKKDIEEAGLPEEFKNEFICPIGLPFGSNDPFEIALSVTAQLIEKRDKFTEKC